jgi:membrane protein
MASIAAPADDPHGRQASSPLALPRRAWREIAGRVWVKTGEDNISLMAAGVAFYAFLAFIPMLGAIIMSYGLFADPSTIADHMRVIVRLVPKDAAKLILDQIVSLVTTNSGKKGLGLAVALFVSLYGAARAGGAIIMALNVIYEQRERRSYLHTTLIAFVMIVAAVAVGVVGLLAASALTVLGKWADRLGAVATIAIGGATWVIAGGLACCAIAAAYRYAPDRHDAQWRWISLGSGLATLLWLLATLGFGAYARTIGHYNATYGSLGAVVVLLMWLYVSAYAVLLGASVNAEIERQLACDSTTGAPKALGDRGATVADEVAPPS